MARALTRWLGAALWACHGLRSALTTAAAPRRSLAERLAMLPVRGLPLEGRVRIFWDAHQIPFIDAQSDRDLAVALGLVHAHLRLAQLELMRRISQGRLAEMVGPLAVELDHGLRLIDFGRAVPEVVVGLPAETRTWLEGFVAGINHYVGQAEPLPPELALLGVGREPWRLEDVLTVGRLASSDVSWLVWFRLLAMRGAADWPQPWRELLEISLGTGGEGGDAAPALDTALLAAGRSGSNAFAVSGRLSAAGAPIMAADPHLGIMHPSLWLVVGGRSPGFQAAGLMIPGLPFIAMGRNPWIAWAGTNLHAASSELVDVTAHAEPIRPRRERIAVRWGWPREVTIGETAFGPVLTSLPLAQWKGPEVLALRWIGHRPSDEIGAMLRLNRARNWDEFRTALDGFAVPGLTFVYAGHDGHVGQAVAAHLPARPPEAPRCPFAGTDELAAWERIVTSRALPARFDPPEGYVVSANERPRGAAEVLCGFFFSPDDRYRRMAELIEAGAGASADAAMRMLQDVLHRRSIMLRDRLATSLSQAAAAWPERTPERRLAAAIAGWDGRYDAESQGALGFELLLHVMAAALVPQARRRAFEASWQSRTLLVRDLLRVPEPLLSATLRRVLPRAARRFARFGTWGGLHRLRPRHPLAATPGIGRRLVGADMPAAGSSETLQKTAHPLTDRRHVSGYGSTARLVADLAEPDALRIVLLGGQDGWPGSSTADDQVALWRTGGYAVVPLTAERAASSAVHTTELVP